MNNFLIQDHVCHATDVNGIVIVNPLNGTHCYIRYPQAAVWSILIQGHEIQHSMQMLRAVLDKNEADTREYIAACLKEWRSLNIIQ